MIQPWTLIRLQTFCHPQKGITKAHRLLVSEGVIPGGLDRCFWAPITCLPPGKLAFFHSGWLYLLSVLSSQCPLLRLRQSPPVFSKKTVRPQVGAVCLHMLAFPSVTLSFVSLLRKVPSWETCCLTLRRGNFFFFYQKFFETWRICIPLSWNIFSRRHLLGTTQFVVSHLSQEQTLEGQLLGCSCVWKYG